MTVDPSFVQGPPALGIAAKTGLLAETATRDSKSIKFRMRFI